MQAADFARKAMVALSMAGFTLLKLVNFYLQWRR
jgi:hypothetical protein